LRVEFLLKTDRGYPKDTGVTLFTLATLGNLLRYNTHRSALPFDTKCRTLYGGKVAGLNWIRFAFFSGLGSTYLDVMTILR